MNKVSGINEQGIDRLILDIADYAEKIQKNYNLIEELVDSTSNFLKGDIGTNYRNNFTKNFKYNFQTINKNILSYTSDLSLVKRRYQNKVGDIVADFNRNSRH